MNQRIEISQDTMLRVLFVMIGMAPIMALCGSIFNIVPLHVSFRFLVLPAYALAVVTALLYWNVGKIALLGMVSGIIAVFLYDLTRWPWVVTGLWGDFIPTIGAWMFDKQDNGWMWGYVWRYLGNGGGMGMAFFVGVKLVEPWMSRQQAGTLFGVSIFGCLLGTLFIAPEGMDKLFVPTVLSFTMGLIGHIVYGSVLGYLGLRWAGVDYDTAPTRGIIRRVVPAGFAALVR